MSEEVPVQLRLDIWLWAARFFRTRMLAKQAIGRVRAVRGHLGFAKAFDPQSRFFSPELGGGALLDLGVYPVAFAWDLFGAPETTTAVGTLGATGTDTQVQATFTYAGGAVASTFSSAS